MAQAKPSFRFTGWHMLVILLTFFGVVVAVNLTMAVMASRSWTGLVVKNSYVASQQFNEQAAIARKQREMGWQESLAHENGALTIVLKDRYGKALEGLSVSAEIGHPVADKFDHHLQLKEIAPGVYSAMAQMGQGQWDADVLAKDGLGREFRQIHRFMVNE
jgi:nitrogen fixation protein FixH